MYVCHIHTHTYTYLKSHKQSQVWPTPVIPSKAEERGPLGVPKDRVNHYLIPSKSYNPHPFDFSGFFLVLWENTPFSNCFRANKQHRDLYSADTTPYKPQAHL